MSQTSISDLPEEMMVKIFSLLPPQYLKSAMLVCKSWTEMGEDPTLWSWSVVTVRSRQDFHKLNIRRFQLIQELDIDDGCGLSKECRWTKEHWIDLFDLLLQLPALFKIDPSFCLWRHSADLSCVEVGLVVSVFKRLEEMHLYMQPNSSMLSEKLFSAIAENKCSIKLLMVWNYSTTTLSPQLFASAVSNVEEVMLGTWNIKHEQMEALFLALTKGERCLRKLDLFSCNTDDIEPALMGEAVNRLEEFTVMNTLVTCDQISAILGKIVKGESKLTNLMLGHLEYGEFKNVDPALVRQVRVKFGDFYYFDEDDYVIIYDEYSDNAMDSDEYVEGEDDNEYVEEVKRFMFINIGD